MTNTADQVLIAGLLFRAGEGSHGFFIDEDGLEGWEDTPAVRLDTIARVAADGDFPSASINYEARILTLSGLCLARSAGELGVLRDRLTGLPRGSTRTSVTSYGVTTSADSTIAGATRFKTVVPGSIARYQISRRFPDPRKYGNTRTLGPGSSVAAFHYGNAAAAPRIIVSGSDSSGYTITGPNGRRYRVTLALTSGSPHTIDMSTGLLTVSSTVRTGVTPQANIWRVPPGQSVTHSVAGASGGSVSMQVTVTDTYL